MEKQSYSVNLIKNGKFLTLSHDGMFMHYLVNPLKRISKQSIDDTSIQHCISSETGDIVVFSTIPEEREPDLYKISIWNTYFNEEEIALFFREAIKGLVLKETYLLVIFISSICVYDISKKIIHFEQITTSNQWGAGDITLCNDKPQVAVCGLVPGSVRISLVSSDDHSVFINAHQHSITNIKYCSASSMIATSSEMGTLINLFDSATGTLITSFRRGNTMAQILSMSFSPGDALLAVFSSKGTLHVFSIDSGKHNQSRCIAKLRFEKTNEASIAFFSDDKILLLMPDGILNTVQFRDDNLTIADSKLVPSF